MYCHKENTAPYFTRDSDVCMAQAWGFSFSKYQSWSNQWFSSHVLVAIAMAKSSSCFICSLPPTVFFIKGTLSYHIQVTKIERHQIDFMSNFLVFSLTSELDVSCFLSGFPPLLLEKKKQSSQSHTLTGSTAVICGQPKVKSKAALTGYNH